MCLAFQCVSLSQTKGYIENNMCFLFCCTGLIYGAEAHLVANLTLNGKYHLVVFGEHFATKQLHSSYMLS